MAQFDLPGDFEVRGEIHEMTVNPPRATSPGLAAVVLRRHASRKGRFPYAAITILHRRCGLGNRGGQGDPDELATSAWNLALGSGEMGQTLDFAAPLLHI